jgi:hypothetical protein
MRGSLWLPILVFACMAAFVLPARAEGMPEFHLVLHDHKFEPATLKVPANTKFKVLVTNRNPTPSEFESSDFNREKIVLPDSTITVFIGPLDKGTYKFFDDFNRASTGTLVAE